MSRFENTDQKVNLLFDENVLLMSIDDYLDLEEQNCFCEGTCKCNHEDWINENSG